MKRMFVILVLAVLAVSAGAADVTIGAKGGPMHNSFWGDDYQGYLSSLDGGISRVHPGFTIGGFMTIGLGKVLAIQPELMLTVGGDSLRFDALEYGLIYDGTVTQRTWVTYLEIPLLMKLQVGPVHLSAGPEVLIPVGRAKLTRNATDGTLQDFLELGDLDEEWLSYDEVEDFIFAAVAGIGLYLPLGSGQILFEARYTMGLTRFNDPNNNDVLPAGDLYKTCGLQLVTGLAIPLK